MKNNRFTMFENTEKDDIENYPIVIEVNRLLQGISKKELIEGVISEASYDEYMQNSVIMPADVANQFFSKLDILYFNNKKFIAEGKETIKAFFEEHMFNEFDQALWRFNEIEVYEKRYLASSLVVEYLLVKLAYNSSSNREVFNHIKSLLKSIINLLDREQLFMYYLYLGIDTYKLLNDVEKSQYFFDKAREYGGHPHVYTWIGIGYLSEGKVIKAMKMFEKAQRRYLNDGNLTGLIFASELFGLSYYRENDYKGGIEVFEGTLGYSRILNRDNLVSNFKNQIAWGYFRLKEYEKALETLTKDRYNNDFTVNSSVTKFLIAFHLADEKLLKELKKEFSNRNKTLHRMICTVLDKNMFFDENGEDTLSTDEIKNLYDLASITHFELKKEFQDILLKHYIKYSDYDAVLKQLNEMSLFCW